MLAFTPTKNNLLPILLIKLTSGNSLRKTDLHKTIDDLKLRSSVLYQNVTYLTPRALGINLKPNP